MAMSNAQFETLFAALDWRRVAMPTLTRLIAEVSAPVEAEAPNAKIEWLPAHHDVYAALSEGLIDLAHPGGRATASGRAGRTGDGAVLLGDHCAEGSPGLFGLGIEAWRRYPHVMANVTRSMRNPFPVALQGNAGARRVSAMNGDSAGIASLLAKSDFLASIPAMRMAWGMEAFGLRARKP